MDRPFIYFNPNNQDLHTIGFRLTRQSTGPIRDAFSISLLLDLYTNIFDMSKILGYEAYAMPTIADHPDHETRASPTGLKLVGRGRSS